MEFLTAWYKESVQIGSERMVATVTESMKKDSKTNKNPGTQKMMPGRLNNAKKR